MTGAERIAAERQRQLDVEGYTTDHDRGHAEELARAAACYALPHDWLKYRAEVMGKGTATVDVRVALWSHIWPWREAAFKSTDRVRDLEKAGALIAAAIDAELDSRR